MAMSISPVKIWRNQKKISRLLNAKGEVVSWTLVRVPPSGFENQAPYLIAVVKIGGAGNIIAQVTQCDWDKIKTGMKVKVVVRRTMQTLSEDPIPYGIKVTPVIQ